MVDPAVHAVKTYRYLRLAMVVLVVGLVFALGKEFQQVGGDCLLTSISAYYYTPVRAFFVSALLAIGVCLVVLKGNTELEDTLLNLAGMLAPVVGLVPTADEGTCSSAPGMAGDPSANILNNMFALFALGLIGLAMTAVLLLRGRRDPGNAPPTSSWGGLAAATLLWLGAVLVFVIDRELFEEKAHYAAAGVMFLCIVAVVGLNALGFGREKQVLGSSRGRRDFVNRYLAVAVAMVVSVALMLLWAFLFDWDHLVFGLEAVLILLFAVFWAVQTSELWNRGLRQQPRPATAPAPRP